MVISIRSRASTKNAPTPTATDKIRTMLGTAGTCPAKTCRSGSEMVTINPSRKEIRIIIHTLRLFVMQEPTRPPMGVMDISAPRVKNIIPTRISTAPIRKHSRMLGEIGAMEKHSASTMQMMGRTAFVASCHFSANFFLISKVSPRSFLVVMRDKQNFFNCCGVKCCEGKHRSI